MKFYCTASCAQIETFTVNSGEYEKDLDVDEVFPLMAAFLNAKANDVRLAYMDLALPDQTEEHFGKTTLLKNREKFTPNEWSQMILLVDFITFVEESLDSKGAKTKSRVLHLCDLNSGAQLTWIHSVI